MRTLRQRREYYRKMEGKLTQDEVLCSMPDDELRMNARKGGIAAITELERRENEKSRRIISQSDIDIGV